MPPLRYSRRDVEFEDARGCERGNGAPLIEPRLSQQDGFLHAGVVVAALDSACGYAALTLMPSDAEVLTVRGGQCFLAVMTNASIGITTSPPSMQNCRSFSCASRMSP
jgi:hypothetical protein